MSTVMHALTDVEARTICLVLKSIEHISVDAYVDERHVVNVWPVDLELTTLQEVITLRAFGGVTDAPICWYPPIDAERDARNGGDRRG